MEDQNIKTKRLTRETYLNNTARKSTSTYDIELLLQRS